MSFGQFLRDVRARLDISQAQLSTRSGALYQSEIAKIESGKNAASSKRVRQALARAFGVGADVIDDAIGGRISVDDFVAAVSRSEGPKSATLSVSEGTATYDAQADAESILLRLPENYALTLGFLIAAGAPPKIVEAEAVVLSSGTVFDQKGNPAPATRRRLLIWADVLANLHAAGDDGGRTSLLIAVTDRLVRFADRVERAIDALTDEIELGNLDPEEQRSEISRRHKAIVRDCLDVAPATRASQLGLKLDK